VAYCYCLSSKSLSSHHYLPDWIILSEIRAENLGSRKNGQENLSHPMSSTLCLVALNLWPDILLKVSPIFMISVL